MARKRTTKKLNGNSTRTPKHGSDNAGNASLTGSLASSVRVTLLLLIGLGIVAFLFYPDISRVVRMMYENENAQSKDKRNDVYHKTVTNTPDVKVETETQRRPLPNDPMEGEDDVEINDENESDNDMFDAEKRIHADQQTGNDETGKHRDQETKINKNRKQTDQHTKIHEKEKRKNVVKESKKKSDEKDTSSRTEDAKNADVLKLTRDEKGAKYVELKVEDLTKQSESEPVNEEKEETTTNEESNKELPEEVRKFKPSYLKTVTAKKIFADGRRIPPIELLAQKPTNSSVKVYLFDEFLSEEECEGLMKAHDRHVQEATKQDPILCFDSITTLRQHLKEARKKISITPNVFTKGTKCVNATFSRQLSNWLKGNWSYSTAFYPGESKFSTIFANRVKAAMGLSQENGGKFQITSYPTGKAYKSHTDCVEGGEDKRDRVATVLVYLQDVEDGGETRFPELGIWVKPRKGRALVWNNMSPEGVCEPHSIHTASKVVKGNKYVLIRWYYYKNFYSLGKRPPEPHLPDRQVGQPRVSCDEYEYGSCRWYDEWSYEHLLEYERKKLTLI